MSQTPKPTDVTNFVALAHQAGVTIPDTQIAVSKSHVILAVNTDLYFYDKEGNPIQGPITTKNFFLDGDGSTLNPLGMDRFFDGRVIYGPYHQRFWIASMARKDIDKTDPELRHDLIVIAVSKSGDPTYTSNPQESWYFYSWDAVADYKDTSAGSAWIAGDGIDYPSLGVDAFNLYTTIGVKTFSAPTDPIPPNWDYYPEFRYWRLVVIEAKSAMGNLGLVIKYDSKDKIEYPKPKGGKVTNGLQPVLHHGSSQRAYFVTFYDKNNILIFAMYDPEKSNPTLDSGTPVQLSPKYDTRYDPPNGPQAPTGAIPIDLMGGIIQNAVFRQGKLYLTNTDARKWAGSNVYAASIRLMRIPVSEYPTIPRESQAGFIDRIFGANNSAANPKENGKLYYYGMPAVEVNKNGDIAIVYTRTSEETFPEMRYSAYYHDENDIRPSRLVRGGEATYQKIYNAANPPESFRWGDIAGICVDPKDDKTIWMAHQYASAEPPGVDGNYRIWISKAFI